MADEMRHRHLDTDCDDSPQAVLHIVRSGVCLSRWVALWDWLLAPDAQATAVVARAHQSPGLDANASQRGQEKGGKG